MRGNYSRFAVAAVARVGGGIALAACLSACAGPVTPLGAVWVWTPSELDRQQEAAEVLPSPGRLARGPASLPERAAAPSRITFSPDRQVLHGPAAVRVMIQDRTQAFDRQQFEIRYNGVNVTPTFLAQSEVTVEPDAGRVRIENPVMRLPANEDHRIVMRYRDSRGETIRASYEPPVCFAYGLQRVRTTGAFRPSGELLRAIDRIATYGGLNPAFLTALIAQESAFDPGQISWAKAIGLTQVTTNAETEIAREHPTWPRFPGIADLPFLRVKLMIAAGEIHAGNEWRLDPEKSVVGGTEYARKMAEKWWAPQYQDRVRRVFRDPQVGLAQLTLASYNSGFSRTLGAFSRRGPEFLKDPELEEARKYVNRIFSYCHHFSDETARADAAAISPEAVGGLLYAQTP